jgi:hypothetical protein
MGNDNKKSENFHKLMKQLEILTHKCNKNFPIENVDSKYNIYLNMSIEGLISEIKISLNNCTNDLKTLLNSSKYSPGCIFKSEEIDGFIQKLIIMKNNCPKNKHYYFNQTKSLFDNIQKKDMDMEKVQICMDIEQTENPAFSNKNKQFQQQVLINKQKVIQAQELALLNDNFGRALASLECFANRYSGKNISNVFGYYDMFNLGNTQDINELQKKAFLQTQIFKLSYEDYIRKYHNYTVPENIDIKTISNYVVTWMYNVPKDHQLMYQGMINIINSSKNLSFDKKFKTYSQQAKNAKMDPNKIASFAPGVYYYNQQRCDEARNQYLEEGKISSILNINQTYKDDTKALYLNYQIQNNQQNHQESIFYRDLK